MEPDEATAKLMRLAQRYAAAYSRQIRHRYFHRDPTHPCCRLVRRQRHRAHHRFTEALAAIGRPDDELGAVIRALDGYASAATRARVVPGNSANAERCHDARELLALELSLLLGSAGPFVPRPTTGPPVRADAPAEPGGPQTPGAWEEPDALESPGTAPADQPEDQAEPG